MREDLTFISDREIVGSGLATSPTGVSWVRDIQEAAYIAGPADTAAAQSKADQADTKADNAQGSADAAQATAASAQASADMAQDRADAAYMLADSKVTKNVGPSFAAAAGPFLRSSLPDFASTAPAIYTQSDEQALRDHIQTLTRIVASLIADGRANRSLTN